MIPKAKKNLHQCEFHLNIMKNAKNTEEFEIGFNAFVISARTVTFVLQKEYKNIDNFENWYSGKQTEMQDNDICKFFVKLRNSIEKEGINGLEFSIEINKLELTGNGCFIPEISSIEILPKGFFYLVNKGSPQEDLLPAEIKGNFKISIFLQINGRPMNVLEVSEKHYQFLKSLVEEWTGIVNISL